jgi:Flp pilus assembly protein TadB
MLSVAVMVTLGQRRSVAVWEQAQLEQRPAWSMRIGERGQVPAVAMVSTTLGIGFALGAVLGGSPGVTVVCTVLALFMLVLAAEFWRMVLRRPELRISADLIQLHGPGIDSELRWHDVGVVAHEHASPTRPGSTCASD